MTLTLLTSHRLAAQEIETLVMPGAVIEGHAEFETECSSCHKMFDKGGQQQLCLDCHEDVAADFEDGVGYHGLSEEVQAEPCSSCHTDHEGRDALIVILDEKSFDHELTDFGLSGSHADAECEDCHAPDSKFREAASTCVDCHAEDEPHQDTMGTNCVDCHQPTEWLEAEFDHDTTNYRLLGKHLDTACLDCHMDRTFPKPANECFDCHADDDAHSGRSGDECGNCHNPADWHDSSFDHVRDTEFELLGKHAELECGDCHSDNPFEDEMDMNCVACHLEDDAHDAHRGDTCDTCHSSEDWEKPVFDHDIDTGFRLLGGHREVACNDCHVEPVFDIALESTCESCHLDDDPHDNSLGSLCESCHTEVSWQDPVFFDHDLSSFPLLGSHNDVDCAECHETQSFGRTESACAACHKGDDPHRGNFDEQCDACHNPVAWELWLFDHNLQTDFALNGAHVDVTCGNCHRAPLATMRSSGDHCADCHRSDDIHDGEFGANCGRCHGDSSFKEVRSLQ